jgi:hypothetical protein
MINTGGRQKQGVVRGCLVPFLVVIGMLASCYGFCMVLFLLQPAGVRGF